MKVNDFYLIDSLDTYELDEIQKTFLDSQLTLYHEASSVIDKVVAIQTLAENKILKELQYEYNTWLFEFLNGKLEIPTTEKETQFLKKNLAKCYKQFGYSNLHNGVVLYL